MLPDEDLKLFVTGIPLCLDKRRPYKCLVNVIKAVLDKMIPVHTPAYQPGNFQKVLITPNQILFFNFYLN